MESLITHGISLLVKLHLLFLLSLLGFNATDHEYIHIYSICDDIWVDLKHIQGKLQLMHMQCECR